jgi:[acyl-carrier-protein] S-malonyltransferase
MGKVAFIYPGQGSQAVGMGKDIFQTYPMAKGMYSRADEILGFEVSRISFEGPEEKLKETQYTQPALYVHSLIVDALIREKGLKPDAVAGHSLGELSALASAGVYDFETGLRIVRMRGQLMQNAGHPSSGIMAAIIGLEPESVIQICKEAGSLGLVQPANFNSPGQIVISGTRRGVERAMNLAKDRGARRIIELQVSGAFHTTLMEKPATAMREFLKDIPFQVPVVPVWANVTAARTDDPGEIKELLFRQLTHSVRWIECIENMVHDGVTRFIEVGPGKVLAGLVKRIFHDVEITSVGSVSDIESIK